MDIAVSKVIIMGNRPYRQKIRTQISFLISSFLVAVCTCCCFAASAQTIQLKKEYGLTLVQLTSALQKRQMMDAADPNYGGIWCEHCHVWHTRAAEAVYPFTITYFINHDERYLQSAKHTAAWL
ncbi:MAG: hypothetical protein EOP49_48100, partial [Sphingobacteriales bacterium]